MRIAVALWAAAAERLLAGIVEIDPHADSKLGRHVGLRSGR
jgi:hypothetical protein